MINFVLKSSVTVLLLFFGFLCFFFIQVDQICEPEDNFFNETRLENINFAEEVPELPGHYRFSKYGYHFTKDNRDVFISSSAKSLFLDILRIFDQIWSKEFGFDYMLYGGSLLGSYRHGGFIPFDDDIDLLVDAKYKKIILVVFSNTSITIVKKRHFYSIFLADKGKKIRSNTKHRWPYIDIFFYTVDETTHLTIQGDRVKHLVSEVFPPIKMPFENFFILVPRCVWRFLVRIYSSSFENECCTHYFNHRLSQPRQRKCMPCTKLYGSLKFTRWKKFNITHGQQMILTRPKTQMISTTWKAGLVLKMSACAYSNN